MLDIALADPQYTTSIWSFHRNEKVDRSYAYYRYPIIW
jgi:hypothetical protein